MDWHLIFTPRQSMGYQISTHFSHLPSNNTKINASAEPHTSSIWLGTYKEDPRRSLGNIFGKTRLKGRLFDINARKIQ